MDNFDSKEFYGLSLSGDPQLRTTTRNYEFKYNSSDHLERVINRVQMEREIKKSCDSKRGNRAFPRSGKTRPTYLKQSLPASNIPDDDQPAKTSSCDMIVKIMSDAEIEAMISQAMLSRPYMPMSAERSESSICLREISSEASRTMGTSEVRRIEPKYSKVSEEVILYQQPQWVHIKPAEKAFANAFVVPGPSGTNTSATPEVPDLFEDRRVSEHKDLLDRRTNSLLGKSSSDLILRNDESDHGGERDTPPDSPLSFGIESPLNDCERAEMLRVLGHVIPNIPTMELDASESQDESLHSDSIDGKQGDDDEEYEGNNQGDNEANEAEVKEESHRRQHFRREQQLQPVESKAPSNPNTNRPINTPRPNSDHSSSRKQPMTPLDKTMKKQIETLKQEKIRIFSKMTSIQEKIIEILDRLRISLVELSLPDGQVEVKLRERNAFEFSVRLSRNFLFPLGRMIEELHTSPKEDFQSATTNEACVKVCGIYGLLNQALQCYHKQLRHFFTDSVPKKLDILLNMVTETTKTCMQKKIFDQRDSLIQCLLLRCNLLTEFVSKFAEQRKSAREEEHPLKSSRREQHKLPRTSSKWELTMNLNNLNMYEPKLVPKVKNKKHHKKYTPTGRLSTRSKEPKRTPRVTERYDSDEGDCIAAPPADPDDTQVRLTDVNNSDSVQMFDRVLEEQPDSEVTRTLIEALQNITKDEVRQMLGPILLNLDSILRNSDNPGSVESVLSLLNSQLMAKYKQPAAENSPQTNDTDQKEATKRSSSYRKEEREKARSRERQCNHAAARKPERLINTANVKRGSTKTTKSSGRPNTRNEKHSLSNTNIPIQHADKNDAKKRSFRSCSVVSDKAAKKPTPAEAASPLESRPAPPPPTSPLPPPTPPTTLAVNEVIPPRSRLHATTSSLSKHKMTSHHVEHTTTANSTTTNNRPAEAGPNNKQKADKFAPEKPKIGDGGSSKVFRKQIAAEKGMSAGQTAVDSEEEDPQQQQFTRVDVPAGKKVGAAVVIPGQVETLVYCSNVMYTFAKFNDENPAISSEPERVLNVPDEDTPEEECFADSCTRLRFSSRNPSFKSTFESTQNLVPPDDQTRVEEEVRKLIEERNNFIEQCKEDPLYTNPQFPEPWKVLSKISHKIANEIFEEFENEISFGEESYVRDFINMEMQT